jgi:hypothetical protein
MLQSDSIGQLDLAFLAERCATETRKFFQNVASDTQYCYELFRRALVLQNQQAYTKVVETYTRLVARQVKKKLHSPFGDEDLEECINLAFANCFRYLRTPDKFANFLTLEAIIKYLTDCANSAAQSHNRKHYRRFKSQAEMPEDENHKAPVDLEKIFIDNERKEKFYALLKDNCKNEQEHVVVEFYLELGLKPREIYAERPDLFADVKHVHRVKQILLERLKRLFDQYKEDFQ